MPIPADQELALYDLDGTLLPWDTQLLFANFVMRKHPLRRILLLPYLLGTLLYACKLVDETFMKRLFLSYLFNIKKTDLGNLAQEFVKRELPLHYYPDLLQTLKNHQEKHHTCILTTASPSFYAPYIAEQLGFDHYYCTEVTYAHRFPLLPQLPIGNNKSETKITRLQQDNYLPPTQSFPRKKTTAYTDSKADLPLLHASDKNVLVNPSQNLLNTLCNTHPVVKTPPLPWSTKTQKAQLLLKQLLGLYPLYDEH